MGHQPHFRREEMYGRAAVAVQAQVRQAIEAMESPEFMIDGAGWGAYRLTGGC